MTPFSGKSFGDVSSDGDVRTSSAYSVGDTVKAWFIGANPRVRTRLQLYPKDNDTLFFFCPRLNHGLIRLVFICFGPLWFLLEVPH